MSSTELYSRLREISLLEGTAALLDWDQQTYLPKGGGENRASQLELLATLRHERLTDPRLRAAAEAAAVSSDQSDQENGRALLRLLAREAKLPSTFIAERTRLGAQCFQVWCDAKPANDFAQVAPLLEKLISLARQETQLVGFDEHPYDALLDNYEWGGKISWVRPALLRLGDALPDLIARAEQRPPPQLDRALPLDRQRALSEALLGIVGMPADETRLDVAPHPFCTTIGRGDYRITTRFDEHDLFSALFSTLHELGHSFYEANLPLAWRGTPKGSAVSLGVHESQSRLFENIIGRSREFSQVLSRLIDLHGKKTVSPEEVYGAVNHVRRSLIRVEADEVTYSLHVIIRMELEIALIEGSLSVKDLPAAWNSLYKKYLGLTPPTDREGVLQDVHWYSGSIGYFPTYVLGNLYGGMIRRALPNLTAQVATGDLRSIGSWLTERIYAPGGIIQPRELIEGATGVPFSEEPFVAYLKEKVA